MADKKDEVDIPPLEPTPGKGGIGRQPPTGINDFPFHSLNLICCQCHALLFAPNPIYPYMDAHLCRRCQSADPLSIVKESEISNKTFAPWTKEQVSSLTSYQQHDSFLPFVCTNNHVLTATTKGLHCRKCQQFKLNWSYPWCLDNTFSYL